MDEVTRHEMRISEFYYLPLLTLVQQAAAVHREAWCNNEFELCALLSIKTGSCGEDCAYCAQSARYATEVESHPLLPVEQIEAFAKKARDKGVKRLCMSAAWSRPPAGEEFARVLAAVEAVKAMGLEACVTLGKLSKEQVGSLQAAGLDYYNHNLDTSPEHYAKVISTRTFADRLKTIEALRGSGVHLCCGGIVGMGESHGDRVSLLAHLANLDPQPSTVPINILVRIPGTPLADLPALDPLEAVRMVAATRIALPRAVIKLSAGRTQMSREVQTLCFVAGVNSIFVGDKLLTTELPGEDFDARLITDVLKPLDRV